METKRTIKVLRTSVEIFQIHRLCIHLSTFEMSAMADAGYDSDEELFPQKVKATEETEEVAEVSVHPML